jgi:glycosyltransferase involved in cell wall biosynthesis
VRGRAVEGARAASRWLGERDPLVRATMRGATVALAVTRETSDRLMELGVRDVALYSAMGFRHADVPQPPERRADQPVRFASVGRMLAWKGFHLGLRAFAAADLPDAEYWMIGDGPDLSRLRKLAARLGVANRVRFCGALPRSESLAALSACHVLVHPSLHDSGGWVCLEAMSACLPVVCLALGGPAEMVTPKTGVRVDVRDARQVHHDLTAALERLAADPALRQRLGAAGRQRVLDHYVWETKGDRLAALYARVTAGAEGSLPNEGAPRSATPAAETR